MPGAIAGLTASSPPLPHFELQASKKAAMKLTIVAILPTLCLVIAITIGPKPGVAQLAS